MKRQGHLWEEIISFQNLYSAFSKAVKGRRTKENVATFIFHAERELLELHDELQGKRYFPGQYRTFLIYDKKKRLISSAPFRDRIVHHALCNIIEPIFEKTFIFDLYSNRKGKGIHRAVKRAQEYAGTNRYVLKCDIRKYFPTIDHLVLKQTIRRKVKCADTLWLVDLIIDKSNAQERVLDYFPGDDLFKPVQRRRGLPIGNQTSQFFSNVYLSPLDHFAKETLGVKGYIRYVDDFLYFGMDKGMLWKIRDETVNFLAEYRLKLKPNGVTLFRVSDGFPFLGYRVLPHALLVSRKAILRFRRKAREMRLRRKSGEMDLKTIKSSIFGSMGHFEQADSLHLRRKLLNEAWV
jgi:retron-type reverse transcriptase